MGRRKAFIESRSTLEEFGIRGSTYEVHYSGTLPFKTASEHCHITKNTITTSIGCLNTKIATLPHINTHRDRDLKSMRLQWWRCSLCDHGGLHRDSNERFHLHQILLHMLDHQVKKLSGGICSKSRAHQKDMLSHKIPHSKLNKVVDISNRGCLDKTFVLHLNSVLSYKPQGSSEWA